MADAEYAIDVAAEMPEGEQTIAQLDSLTAQLMSGGRGSDQFSEAIAKVSSQLGDAQRAAESANGALAAGQEEYRQLEKASLKASKAAERAALKNQGVIPEKLAADAAKASRAVDQYTTKLQKVEKEAARASAANTKLGKTMKNLNKLNRHVTDQLGDSATKLSTFRGALGDVGGPLGEFGEKLLFPVQAFVDLNEWFGTSAATAVVLAIGIAALIAIVVALTAAMIAGVLAATKYAIGLADVKRSADLAKEALVQLHPELAGVTKIFKEVTNSTGVAEKRLTEISKALIDAKVSAEDLPGALRAAATAEAALGAGGANKFIADIKKGKLAVDEFTVNMQQKFGGIVARQMMGLSAQSERLKRNFSDLFSGLEIDKALGGMNTLVRMFDKSTVAGRAAKTLFDSVFQPIVDQAQTAAFFVEAFYLGFLIGLTKIFIAVKPAIKAIREFFGFEDTGLEDVLAGVTVVGQVAAVAFVALSAVIAALAITFGVFLAAIALIPVAVLAVWWSIKQLIDILVKGLVDAINFVMDLFAKIDLAEVGKQMLLGLAQGLSAGAGVVVGALTGVIRGAISAAKSVLGIASPSKVFAEIGTNTGEGFEGGIEDTTKQTQQALANMVEPPDEVTAPSASPLMSLDKKPAAGGLAHRPGDDSQGPGAGASAAVNFSGATFNFFGIKDAKHSQKEFGEMLTRVLEGDVNQLGGAGPEGAPA